MRREMFRAQYAEVFQGDRAVEKSAGAHGRDVRMGRNVHLHQEAALFRRHGGLRRADQGFHGDARAGGARRFGDNGSHLAGRHHSGG